MITKCFQIKCLTNLHVGNGDVNFSIIDNEVERDSVTGFPTINASGVKGALRVFLKDDANKIAYFGSESGSTDNLDSGKLKFFAANMLAIPMRASDGNAVYHLVTNPTAIDLYRKLCGSLSVVDKCSSKPETVSDCEAEGYPCAEKYNFNGTETFCMKDANFQKVKLPVVARNQLKDGISNNLWYEEIVPHESIFYFFVAAADSDKTLLHDFANAVEGKVIQFGGNASVGCGYCLVSEVKGANGDE